MPAALAPLRPQPQLYEINTWPWLDRLSGAHGRQITLGTVPDSEWDRLRSLGFDVIYLMGVWKRSPRGRYIARTLTDWFRDYDAALPGWTPQDVVGSPYSVGAYEPDAHVGTFAELADVQRKLHARGMRLVLDFVPNHTGQDHPWVSEHPEYYIQGSLAQFRARPGDFFLAEDTTGKAHYLACGRDPYFPAWSDTAQLNYFSPGLRKAMVEQLKEIAKYCDGLRCDMAMLLLTDTFQQTWTTHLNDVPLPPTEFWEEATRAMPQMIWIAEAYSDSEWSLQQLGFNFTYDKRLYDRLRESFARDVYLHLKADLDYQLRSVRFLENHDEPRAAAVFSNDRSPAVPLLAATAPGMHFFHDGQLEGKRVKIPVQLARAQEEATDGHCLATYEKVLRLADAPEFHSNDWQLLNIHSAGDDTHQDLIAYLWQGTNSYKLVVVNLSFNHSSGRVELPNGLLPDGVIDLEDVLNDRTYRRATMEMVDSGLFVLLDSYGAHVFSLSAAGNSASAAAGS
jgi:hypothetical protein